MFRCGKSVTCTSSEFDALGLKNLFEVANIKLLDSKEITREFYEKAVNYCHKELHLGCCSSPRSASDTCCINNPHWQNGEIIISLCKYYIVISDALVGSLQ